jgi:sugar/nucleoside kinase (ribokinase family)
MKKGLFIGLSTLDIIYLTENIPQQNEKIVALDDTLAAGGPASNAAVTFAHLGNQAHLLTIIGNHPISNLIQSDLTKYKVKIYDLEPQKLTSPAVSSILVTKSTGNRAVISLNATKYQANRQQIPANILDDVDIILIDGHQMLISEELARQAKLKNIPVVVDGGSWKQEFDKVLPFVDYIICSANFYPPHCKKQEEIFNYLESIEIKNIAITQGEKPIIYSINKHKSELEIDSIKVVDTLGAGDIFHGAFCHYILEQDFPEALKNASKVATKACQFFGTRKWLNAKDFSNNSGKGGHFDAFYI